MKTHAQFTTDFLFNYPSFKNENLKGRYIIYDAIKPELEKLKSIFTIKNEGFSTLNIPIPSITIGNGKIKVLAWSQMHGNESTTTKAVFDVLNYLKNDEVDAFSILKNCTIKIIPMLNPDGAKAYTRVNANSVDLNRDAFELQEKESKILNGIFNKFKPHYCLNLHDQRTIFSAGETKNPATISFLAPAMDEERSINESRAEAMKVISAINNYLQPVLKNQIGRYDDAYNKNCTGDAFMGANIPTILFEAGHFNNDYQREETRKYIALALFSTLKILANYEVGNHQYSDYFEIPENSKLFYDVILRNTVVNDEIKDVGIQFKEELSDNQIIFKPIIQEINSEIKKIGHKEVDCNGKDVFLVSQNDVKEYDIVHQIRLNDSILSINML